MPKIEQRATVTVEVPLVLTEIEARALAKVSEWGADAVVMAICTVVSERELEPYKRGLVTLLEAARGPVSAILKRADEARKVFEKPSG